MSQTISIDFGGTTIKAAVVEDGKIKLVEQLPAYSERGLLPRLKDTEDAVRALMAKCGGSPIGVGVAMPGLVDAKRGRVTELYQKYEDSIGYDMSAWCEERFHLPMAMEQDSKAALLGETAYGCAKGFDNALLLILGTGLGTAVMLGGSLMDSGRHMAGSLGSHIIIEMDGRECTCHGHGCLEAYVSGWSLPGIVREEPRYAQSGLAMEDVIDFKRLKKWIDQNDPVALAVIAKVAKALRTGVISLIHAYDPDVVVLSGGPLQIGEALTKPALDGINGELWGAGRSVAFRISEHPEESVLLGLHRLVLQGVRASHEG